MRKPARKLRTPRAAPAVVALVVTAVAAAPAAAEDAYVPNQASDNLTIFDIRDTADKVTRALGDQPHEAAVRRDARYVFISNRLDDELSVYDALTRSEVDIDGTAANGVTRIAVGSQPHGLAMTPDDRHLFVANDASNDVTVVDARTFAVVSTVPNVGLAPHMIAISPDGREAWVGNINGGDVSLIDVEKAINDPANAVICVTPGGAGPDCRIQTGAGTEGVAFTKDGRTVYAANGGANTVSVIDTATRTVTATLPVPGSPRRVHVRPDGLRAYVSQLFGNDVAVIDTASHALVPAELITNVPSGLGMDFRADSAKIYVANFFSATLSIIDLPDTSMRESVATGAQPDSAVILPVTVHDVRFSSDRVTLSWETHHLADRYNVYRGTASALPGVGACRNGFDPDLTDTVFTDAGLPPAGDAFTYLVSITHDGIEGVLGYATDGTPREPSTPCP